MMNEMVKEVVRTDYSALYSEDLWLRSLPITLLFGGHWKEGLYLSGMVSTCVHRRETSAPHENLGCELWGGISRVTDVEGGGCLLRSFEKNNFVELCPLPAHLASNHNLPPCQEKCNLSIMQNSFLALRSLVGEL